VIGFFLILPTWNKAYGNYSLTDELEILFCSIFC
jgi:hypothetical protein